MREFYRTTIVQIGFGCDYLMRAILAVSSLHLAHGRHQQREYYQNQAVVHHQTASRAAMPLLSDTDRTTAQKLFLFTILTNYYGESVPFSNVGFTGSHKTWPLSTWMATNRRRQALSRQFGLSRLDLPFARM